MIRDMAYFEALFNEMLNDPKASVETLEGLKKGREAMRMSLQISPKAKTSEAAEAAERAKQLEEEKLAALRIQARYRGQKTRTSDVLSEKREQKGEKKSKQAAGANFHVGERVEANWKGEGEWYPGKVARAHYRRSERCDAAAASTAATASAGAGTKSMPGR